MDDDTITPKMARDSYPAHPRYGAAHGGKPFTVEGVTFYAYSCGIMQYVRADPVSGAEVREVSWKNGNPRGYQGYTPSKEKLPIRKTREAAAKDAVKVMSGLGDKETDNAR